MIKNEKKYMKPEMKVVMIKEADIICTSGEGDYTEFTEENV